VDLQWACINLRMSKRIYESGSIKRKKATTKADTPRAVIEKTK